MYCIYKHVYVNYVINGPTLLFNLALISNEQDIPN